MAFEKYRSFLKLSSLMTATLIAWNELLCFILEKVMRKRIPMMRMKIKFQKRRDLFLERILMLYLKL